MLLQTLEDKLREQNMLKFLVEKHGTKIGNIIFYLKKTWTENPSAKFIIFSQVWNKLSLEYFINTSQFNNMLAKISEVFEDDEVDYAIIEGYSPVMYLKWFLTIYLGPQWDAQRL